VPLRPQNFVLSDHFVSKWTGRFGAAPDPAVIRRIVRKGAWVSRCCDVRRMDGRKERMLAVYVDFGRRVAVKMDEINNVAVTFVSAEDCVERSAA